MSKRPAKAAARRAGRNDIGESSVDTEFGRELLAGVNEAVAYMSGDKAMNARVIETMTPERVKAIRKRYATSTAMFEKRFGVPRRTLEGWEAGKRLDLAGRLLLQVIEREPEAVERAIAPRAD